MLSTETISLNIPLVELHEYPILPFEITKPEEEAQARDSLRILASIWSKLKVGQEIYAQAGIKATLEDILSSAVSIVKALAKANAICIHPSVWSSSIKEFMDEVISRVEKQGYHIPIEESANPIPKLVPLVVTYNAISILDYSIKAKRTDWVIKSIDRLLTLESFIDSQFKVKENHFIYELKGPSSSYIPVGDFILVPYVDILQEAYDPSIELNSIMVDSRYLNIVRDSYPIQLRVNSSIEDPLLTQKLELLFKVTIEVKFTQVPQLGERPIGKLTFIKYEGFNVVEVNEPEFRPYLQRIKEDSSGLANTNDLLKKIEPSYLEKITDEELLQTHDIIHNSVGSFGFDMLRDAHIYIVRELTKRNLDHKIIGDDIDIQSTGLTNKVIHESQHSRSKCMDCSKPPVVELLWAEGMGHVWFCDEHFNKWANTTDNIDKRPHKDDVSSTRELKWGVASDKWSDGVPTKKASEEFLKEGVYEMQETNKDKLESMVELIEFASGKELPIESEVSLLLEAKDWVMSKDRYNYLSKLRPVRKMDQVYQLLYTLWYENFNLKEKYADLASLPPWVKKMPEGAQHIFKSAFNAAWEQYNKDEVKAFKVAINAVKSKYEKKGDTWVAKEAAG